MGLHNQNKYTLQTGAEYIYNDSGQIIGFVKKMEREFTSNQYFASSLYKSKSGYIVVHNYCHRATNKSDAVNNILRFESELDALKTKLKSIKNEKARYDFRVSPNTAKLLEFHARMRFVQNQINKMNQGFFR